MKQVLFSRKCYALSKPTNFTGGGVPGAITLAPSGKDDGLLAADEILDLKLSAELVFTIWLTALEAGDWV